MCDTEKHLSLGSHQTIILAREKKGRKKKKRPQRQQEQQQTLTLKNIAVKNPLPNDRPCCNLGATFRRNTLDFNDANESTNEQVKTSSAESGMNTLARADR